MSVDTAALVEGWRAEALRGERVSREVCAPDGALLNYHARIIARPLDELYQRLARMGGGLDDVWPMAPVPMKAEGALQPGVRAAHGPIRYELVAVENGCRIEWRFTMEHLHGRYEYTLSAMDAGTLVENVIDGAVTGEMIGVWPSAVGPLHDWVLERILDRLEAPPAPWFDPRAIRLIR
ncbi:MAG: hypothetical protein HY874_06530 [Chloroflexi bacterium]|nr:hypothetical protein [Chloroflexota bacterium]